MIAVYVLLALILAGLLTHRLIPAIFISSKSMPTETLKGRHNDWPWPLRWIPRRWSAFISKKYPILIIGKSRKPVLDIIEVDGVEKIVPRRDANGAVIMQYDIPRPGNWNFCWPLYISITFKNGFHIRIGIRKDYHDPMDGGYWTLSIGGHKVPVLAAMEEIYDSFYNRYCR